MHRKATPGTLEYSDSQEEEIPEDLGTKSFAKGGRDKYNKKDKTTEKNPPYSFLSESD